MHVDIRGRNNKTDNLVIVIVSTSTISIWMCTLCIVHADVSFQTHANVHATSCLLQRSFQYERVTVARLHQRWYSNIYIYIIEMYLRSDGHPLISALRQTVRRWMLYGNIRTCEAYTGGSRWCNTTVDVSVLPDNIWNVSNGLFVYYYYYYIHYVIIVKSLQIPYSIINNDPKPFLLILMGTRIHLK